MTLARIGRIFPRNEAVVDTVTTTWRFEATPEQVWDALMFYEDVPARPSPFLGLFIPLPVKSEGEKRRVGGMVQCTYDGGTLEKRITALEPARRIAFDVCAQALGIEDAIAMCGGSYEIRGDGDGAIVALSTRYRGHLRPRLLFRPLERVLAGRVHGHILRGMTTALAAARSGGETPPVAVDG